MLEALDHKDNKMAVDQGTDPEIYNDNAIAIDLPRPVGPGGQIKAEDFAKIPQHSKFGSENPPTDPSYNEMPNASANPPGDKVASSSRSKNAPKADNPTTASEDPSAKLPQAVMNADPNGQSQILINMMKGLATVGIIMAMAHQSKSSQTARSPINTPTGTTLANAFGGALAFLSKTYGAEKVLTAFDNGFGVFGISEIHSR